MPPMIANVMIIGNVWKKLIPMNCMASIIRPIVTRFFDLIRSLMNPDGRMLIRLTISCTAKIVPIWNPENPIDAKYIAQKKNTPVVIPFTVALNIDNPQIFLPVFSIYLMLFRLLRWLMSDQNFG